MVRVNGQMRPRCADDHWGLTGTHTRRQAAISTCVVGVMCHAHLLWTYAWRPCRVTSVSAKATDHKAGRCAAYYSPCSTLPRCRQVKPSGDEQAGMGSRVPSLGVAGHDHQAWDRFSPLDPSRVRERLRRERRVPCGARSHGGLTPCQRSLDFVDPERTDEPDDLSFGTPCDERYRTCTQ